MSQPLRVSLGIVVVVLIAGPAVLAVHDQYQMRNFRVVQEGVLYRSGQMTRRGLERAIHDYGIRTVICLRDGLTAADQAEEKYCTAEGVRFVRIPPSSWS